MEMILKMALTIPLSDIMAFSKLGKAYFNLLDVLCHNHTQALAMQDTASFTFILMSLDAGLKSLEISTSTVCATAIDNLAGQYFRDINREDGPSPAAKVIEQSLPAFHAIHILNHKCKSHFGRRAQVRKLINTANF